MLKTLMTATALTGLMVGAALAEGTPSPSSSTMSNPSAATAPAPAASDAKFISSQSPDQYLASKFKGTDVIGVDNQKIGDVSDMLFDKDGKIEAYIVGVGGFLGIGSKDVAIAPASFKVIPGDKSKNEADKLQLSMTKDQLKQAANFEAYKAPRTTTGAATGAGAGSRSSTMAPATAPGPAPTTSPVQK